MARNEYLPNSIDGTAIRIQFKISGLSKIKDILTEINEEGKHDRNDGFKTEECKIGGSLVLVVLAPFMAKMGISSGANVAKLVSVGPALLLQEFGNLGTILLSMPLALLLGLKKESIGACYSINRDSNLGLTTDIFGPDAPETKGTFEVYLVGSVIGTVFISILDNRCFVSLMSLS